VRGELKQFFSDEKTLENRALNLTEAQPLRAVLARLLCRLRPGGQDPLKAELVRRGMVIIEDFLQPTFFAAVESEKDELMATTDPTWFVLSGTTEVRRHSLAQVDPKQYRSSCSGGPRNELSHWRRSQNEGGIHKDGTEAHLSTPGARWLLGENG
jgi:hypothetical protein